jgi:hypothetical protein
LSGTGTVRRAFAALLLWAIAISGDRIAARPTGLSGVVRDSMGGALAGVEILVLPEEGSAFPLAGATTDVSGQFSIVPLPAGLYRIAALKQGYLGYLARVNTSLRSSLEVVLRPAPPVSTPLPDDLAWALRLPGRSLLRETTLSADPNEARGGSRSFGGFLADAVQGELEHQIVLSWAPGGASGFDGDRGARTRMKLGGAVGERANLRFEAARDRFEESPADSTSRGANWDSSTVRLKGSWQPGAASKIAFETFVGDRSLEFASGGPELPALSGGEERSWGAGARWSRELGSGARFDLSVGLLDFRLAAPRSGTARPSSSDAASGRSIGAEGWYESLGGREHRFRVGVAARRLEEAEPGFRSFFDGSLPAGAAASDWTVRVKAEDLWDVAGPVALLVGTDYAWTTDGDQGAGWFLPTLGSVVHAGPLVARAAVRVAVPAGRGARVPTTIRDWGYEGGLEASLPRGFRASGQISARPLDGTLSGAGADDVSEPYASDGFAAVRSARLGIARESPAYTVELALSRTEVEGRVAARPSFIVPLAPLEEQRLEHVGARIGLRLPRTGTDVRAGYSKLELRSEPGAEAAEGVSGRYGELVVGQQVAQLKGRRASCRLVVSASSMLGGGGGTGRSEAQNTALRALNRQVSAGLAVGF